MKIQVRINHEGVLRNQRYAFTDRFTLISELLQNARRSGATKIEIHYDAPSQVLRVADNGCGIDDFQKLLSFNESGWDSSTCVDEHPFGVGFSKCLYAASRCVVVSNHQRVDIDTAAALASTPVEVVPFQPTEETTGTRIALYGVVLPDLDARIESLCLGFPVAVFFNGKALERPLAQAHLATSPSPIGALHLKGLLDGQHSHSTMVFLQGFCVMNIGYRAPENVNVVHLDARQFMARLPDRDKLIDEDLQRKRIDAELKSRWRQALEVAKTGLPATDFVEIYYPAMRAWGHLDMLNDLDVLPREVCNAIIGYPVQDDSGDQRYVQSVEVAPTREAVESRNVTLVALDSVNDDNAAHWMLARARGYLVFDWTGLHVRHWVQRYVRHLQEEAIKVQAVSEQVRSDLDGRWVWPVLVLCDAVRIALRGESVDITGEGVYHDGCLYIPRDETTGEAVRQVSAFTDEHEKFMEVELDADRAMLAELIRRLRCVDAVQTLDSLLCELRLAKYPLLHGKTFSLCVGTGSAPGHSVQEVC